MPSDYDALANIIAQVETLISTTTPLPENRTPRCLELLRAAEVLAREKGTRWGGQSQPEMDAAAERARPELEQHHSDWNVRQLADWWYQWHISAGHRRLGRMLMNVTGAKPKSGIELSEEEARELGLD